MTWPGRSRPRVGDSVAIEITEKWAQEASDWSEYTHGSGRCCAFLDVLGCFAPALLTSSALPADQSTVAGIFSWRGGPECIDVLSPLNANSRTDHGEEIASATGDLKLPLRLPKTRVCSALV